MNYTFICWGRKVKLIVTMNKNKNVLKKTSKNKINYEGKGPLFFKSQEVLRIVSQA